MGFIIGTLIFSIPATIIAAKKGFAPLRWMMSLGIIGLGIVIYLPDGHIAGITADEAQQRVNRANTLGARLAWVNLGLDVIGLVYLLWTKVTERAWQPEAIPLVLLGITYCVSERIIAFRWLVADTSARKSSFSLWAFLTLVLPVLGIGSYLMFRPKDQNVLPWHLPHEAAMSLAVLTSLFLTAPSLSMSYYQHILGMPIASLVTIVKILPAIFIGLSSWAIAQEKRGAWQNNPLLLLFGLLLAIMTIFYHLMDLPTSYGGFILHVLVFSLAAVCVISALTHLTRFEIDKVIGGLLLGYIAALSVFIGLRNFIGVPLSLDAVVMLIALPLAHTAYLSSRGELVQTQNAKEHINFLKIASPFWGLLILQLFVAWGLR